MAAFEEARERAPTAALEEYVARRDEVAGERERNFFTAATRRRLGLALWGVERGGK